MILLQSTAIAFRALGVNKLRAALTVLGIIIGTGAVIALISVGQSARSQITASVNLLGTNLLFVRPSPPQLTTQRSRTFAQPMLTYDDAVAVAGSGNPAIVGVAAEYTSAGEVLVNGTNWFTRITATTPDYPKIRGFTIAAGTFFDQRHLDARSRVVVLGPTVASKLFAGRDPIDQTVKISINGQAGQEFKVIGVTRFKGVTGFSTEDDQIMLPLTTMHQRLLARDVPRGQQELSVIDVEVSSPALMNRTAADIGVQLRARHRVTDDDFRITSEAEVLQVLDQVTSIFTIVLGAIAGISLLVGGIGIMNIMLVSVTERTREIGIRRAIGARRRDILYQFVIEAIVVSLAGGVIGVGLGIAMSRALALVPVNGRYLQTFVSPGSIVLAVGVAAGIGLFFGFFPALRAARLRPIEALRYE